MSTFFNLFKRRKVPLACTLSLEHGHVHTQACFVEIMPLSVVELFQSQGCKSCPPALPLIHDATNNPNLLLLTYDVTYWNYQWGGRGWRYFRRPLLQVPSMENLQLDFQVCPTERLITDSSSCDLQPLSM
ncbi:hypothetical protein LTS17_009432 [Exophiala oligosperma]